jgi:hypothetical protein
MKYDAAFFVALAVSMESVCAAPAQEAPYALSTPSDPFVACVQKTFPRFPKEGEPTTEQLRACFPGARPQVARELVSRNALDEFDSVLQPRGWSDLIQVLGKPMGVDQKSACSNENGEPTKLHDEFVWVEDVVNAADNLCDQALKVIESTGLTQDGGIGYASKQFDNAHDKQSNFLHNKRKLLLTMAINFYPPAAIVQDQIKTVAKGVRDLCAASVSRLMDTRDGCTSQVSWYNSGRAKFDKHLAAVGGHIGMFFESSSDAVGQVALAFTEDDN